MSLYKSDTYLQLCDKKPLRERQTRSYGPPFFRCEKSTTLSGIPHDTLTSFLMNWRVKLLHDQIYRRDSLRYRVTLISGRTQHPDSFSCQHECVFKSYQYVIFRLRSHDQSFSKVCVFSEFDPSTRHRYCCVFKSFHSGDRFRKFAVSSKTIHHFSPFSCGRDMKTQQNVCVFQMKTHPCGLGTISFCMQMYLSSYKSGLVASGQDNVPLRSRNCN